MENHMFENFLHLARLSDESQPEFEFHVAGSL